MLSVLKPSLYLTIMTFDPFFAYYCYLVGILMAHRDSIHILMGKMHPKSPITSPSSPPQTIIALQMSLIAHHQSKTNSVSPLV